MGLVPKMWVFLFLRVLFSSSLCVAIILQILFHFFEIYLVCFIANLVSYLSLILLVFVWGVRVPHCVRIFIALGIFFYGIGDSAWVYCSDLLIGDKGSDSNFIFFNYFPMAFYFVSILMFIIAYIPVNKKQDTDFNIHRINNKPAFLLSVLISAFIIAIFQFILSDYFNDHISDNVCFVVFCFTFAMLIGELSGSNLSLKARCKYCHAYSIYGIIIVFISQILRSVKLYSLIHNLKIDYAFSDYVVPASDKIGLYVFLIALQQYGCQHESGEGEDKKYSQSINNSGDDDNEQFLDDGDRKSRGSNYKTYAESSQESAHDECSE